MEGVVLELSKDQEPKGGGAADDDEKAAAAASLFVFADKVDWLLMVLGAVGSCLHGAALPLFVVLFGQMIDSLGSLPTDPRRLAHEVSKHSLQLVYLGLATMASAWMGVAFWMHTGERQTARLRVKYIESVLRKDVDFFDAGNENILYHISSDAVLVQDAIGDKMGHTLRYISQFFVGFVIGFATVWQLTLLTLAVLPLMVIAGGAYAIIMASLSKKGEAAYAKAGNVAEEAISQVRTVYANVGEHRAVKKYSESLDEALEIGKKVGVAKGLGVGFTYGLLFCAWALLLWYAGILVRHKVTNGGKAFTTIMIVIISGFSLGQAAPNLGAFAKGRAAAANMLRVIKSMPSRSVEDHGMILDKVDGCIEFKEVSFVYPSRKNKIFEGLSLTIGSKQIFAIVGPSGSGKSTIISMIERFYGPIAGEILLDGHDIKKLQLKWLRMQLGLVSQEPALFSTSITENILYGSEGADFQDVLEAARMANADDFIRGLPDGYLTQVGEGGTQLSGGQKQRIAIARAVLRKPKILLLDEATSALDAESEHVVQQALDKVMVKRTTIIVAHRLSTICNVDRIIVLKDGRVVESGSHVELMSKGEDGEYAKLVRLQLSGSYSEDHGSKKSSRKQTELDEPSEIRSAYQGGGSRSKVDEYPMTAERNNVDMEANNIINRKTDILVTTKTTKPTTMSSIWRVMKLNKPEWPFALLGSIGATLAGMEAPLFALGITHVLAAFYSQQESSSSSMQHEVQQVALIFVGAAVITVPIYLLQHYYYTIMGEMLTARVRLLMFSAMLRNEVGWFDLEENSTGALSSKLASDATMVRSALADRLSTLVQNAALTITAFVIAFFLSWRMAAVVVATYPLLIAASIAEQMFLKGLGGDYYGRSYGRANSLAREAVGNIRTVVALGVEDRIAEEFSSELSKRKAWFLRGHVSGLSYGLSQLLAFSSYALALWYASRLLLVGRGDFGALMKSFMILIITSMSIAETLSLAPHIVKGTHALSSVFSVLDRHTAIDPHQAHPPPLPADQIRGTIQFNQVELRYPTRPEVAVLRGLNLMVPAGTKLAVVGRSGSGKSSMISLLLRFYDPTRGAVMVDGVDVRRYDLRGLRRRIGVVQQEPVLFSTTILENIAYGIGGDSSGEEEEEEEVVVAEAEVVEAARASGAHGFISEMEEGYRTRVGEKGVMLSGGQRQRVAIARALMRGEEKRVMVMDEATSALDGETERKVQEAVWGEGRGWTVVAVAHRLSTVRRAARIAVVGGGGRVVEMGTHEELLQLGGEYCHLVKLQQQQQQQQQSSPS